MYSNMLTKYMAESIQAAKVVVITFGFIEQFYSIVRNKLLFYNQHPYYYGLHLSKDALKSTELMLRDYFMTLHDINSLILSLRKITSAPIVFSVSPVPLERTFRKKSNIYEANVRSKSTLLLATRDAVESHENTFYFPSYEIVTSFGSRGFDSKDLRHVRQEVVDQVINLFLQAANFNQ